MQVLIPVYNMAGTLRRAVDSVLAQTSDNWQLHIGIDALCDDGSEELARQIISEHPDKRITMSRAEEPSVIGVYRQCFPMLKPGDRLMGVLDADDELAPTAVERILPHFKDANLTLLWTQHIEMPSGKPGCSKALPYMTPLQNAMCGDWWGASHFRVFRLRRFLASHLPLSSIPYANDQNIVCTLAATNPDCKFLDEPLYRYHTDGQERETTRYRAQQRHAFNAFRKRLRDYLRTQPITLANRSEMLEHFPKNSVGAEIGVDLAKFSMRMVKIINPKLLWLVDFWHPSVLSTYPDYHPNLEKLAITARIAIEHVLKPMAAGQVRVLCATSFNAARLVENESLDWVFIDAGHLFHETYTDLMLWYPKVKVGGIVSGHDFFRASPMFGVERAVRDFVQWVGNPKINYTTERAGSFWFTKERR